MQSINAIIEQWKGDWTAQHERTSRYPLEFWRQVADLLIEGRLALKNNPLVAIGRYAFDWPGALELLVTRNNRAIALEKTGQIDLLEHRLHDAELKQMHELIRLS